MIPAPGVRGETLGIAFRDADDATAVHAQRPLMRAADQDVRAITVQGHAPESLRDVHRDQRVRREPAHGLMQRFPVDAVAVVKAHQ